MPFALLSLGKERKGKKEQRMEESTLTEGHEENLNPRITEKGCNSSS